MSLIELIERNNAIMRHQPRCPRCGTAQVQIMDRNVPARWRCRMCKHWFTSEPLAPSRLTDDN